MEIVNPYQITRENVDEINLFYKLVIENNGDSVYFNRLKVAVSEAKKRRELLSPKEREIVAEIFKNKYEGGMFTGEYLTELSNFLESVEKYEDIKEDESTNEYIVRRFGEEAIRRRMKEAHEGMNNIGERIVDDLGGLLGKLFKTEN